MDEGLLRGLAEGAAEVVYERLGNTRGALHVRAHPPFALLERSDAQAVGPRDDTGGHHPCAGHRPNQRAADDRTLDYLRRESEQRNGDLRALRQPDHRRPPPVRPRTDQLHDLGRGAIDRERRVTRALAVLGKVGNEQVVVGQTLDLRSPHPSTTTPSVEEDDRGCVSRTTLVNVHRDRAPCWEVPRKSSPGAGPAREAAPAESRRSSSS